MLPQAIGCALRQRTPHRRYVAKNAILDLDYFDLCPMLLDDEVYVTVSCEGTI